jgi:hypothetical protein
MPYKRTIHGQTVYWPERCNIGNRKVLLDPKQTPMENCWRVIKIVTLVRLTMFKIFSYDYGDMADLETMVQIATYNRLRDMVKNGEYERRYSFYLNCRAACWSIAQHVLDKWLADIKQRYNNLDGNGYIGDSENSSLTLFDSLASHKVTRLMTDSDYSARFEKRSWHEFERQGDRTRVLREETRKAYDQYCEDCLLYGVKEVLSYDDFIKRNYSESELDLICKRPRQRLKKANAKAGRPRFESTNDKKEAQREYNRAYYQRHKESARAYAAEYRAQNRDKIKEYQRKWYQKQKEKAVT